MNGLNQYEGTSNSGVPNWTYEYDPNGNLKRSVDPAGTLTTSFVYDVENRLVSASGAKAAGLVYDPLGRLFQVSGGAGGPIQFLYDGDALVSEYDGELTRPHVYVHGVGQDVPLVWYEGGGGGRRLYADHQGSVVAIAHPYNAYLAINGYDAWGIPNANNKGRFQYTGQVWLPELGMYHYKARIYSPTLGRFLQTDPVGYEDQMNLYGYVGNDPVNHRDPTGKTCQYVSAQRSYDCKIDSTRNWAPKQIEVANRNYTLAVNQLLKHPDRQLLVRLMGKEMRGSAREVARGLIRAHVVAGDRSSTQRAQTLGGGVTSKYGTFDGRPIITLNSNALQRDFTGGAQSIERDLSVTFIHEGLHTLPQERAFQSLFDGNPKWFNDFHARYYTKVANELYDD